MAAVACEIPHMMMETGLFKAFTHTDFNKIKCIDRPENDQGPRNDPTSDEIQYAVDKLAKLVTKYNLQDLIGICLTHNHFKLNDGEIVQTSLQSNKNIRGCIDNPNGDAPVFFMEAAMRNDSQQQIPYMWAYDKTSKSFFAMQFFSSSFINMAERLNTLAKQENLASFLKEFIDELEKMNMQDELGIYLQYVDLVKYDNIKEVLYENTDVSKREQILFPIAMKNVEHLVKQGMTEKNTKYTLVNQK